MLNLYSLQVSSLVHFSRIITFFVKLSGTFGNRSSAICKSFGNWYKAYHCEQNTQIISEVGIIRSSRAHELTPKQNH